MARNFNANSPDLLSQLEKLFVRMPDGNRLTVTVNRNKPVPEWQREMSQMDNLVRQEYVRPGIDPREHVVYVLVPFGTQLVIDLRRRRYKANGEPTKPANIPARVDVFRSLPEAERELLALIKGSRTIFDYGMREWEFPIHDAQEAMILPRLVATGKLYGEVMIDERGVDLVPLKYDEGEPLDVILDAQPLNKRLKVHLSIERGDWKVDRGQVRMHSAGGHLLIGDTLYRVRERTSAIWSYHNARHLDVPYDEADDWLAALSEMKTAPRVRLPESLNVKTLATAPQPCLRILESSGTRQQTAIWFEYEGVKTGFDHTGAYVWNPRERRLIRRDLQAESAAVQRLADVGAASARQAEGNQRDIYTMPRKQIMATVAALASEGWRIEADGRTVRSSTSSRSRVVSAIDWFELHAEVAFDDQVVKLPALLEAVAHGEKSIVLADGSLGLLPEDWLAKIQLLAGMGKRGDDGEIRFKPGQVAILDALLAAQEQDTVQIDEQFRAAREQLHRFKGVEPASAPDGFVGELRTYQKEGLGWLKFLQDFRLGGCLADDMGLGKTIQVLALLQQRKEAIQAQRNGSAIEHRPSLIVVPRSLVFNWQAEAKRFAPALRFLDHSQQGRQQDPAGFGEHDVILTTYGILRRDAHWLKDVQWDYVILDESQAVKNAATASFKAARLMQGRHRLALTGTPIENHLGELWALLEFLNPGVLGTSSAFAKLTRDCQDADSRATLAAAVRPMILRRTKQVVARDLPEKNEQTILCDLPARQRRYYNELRDHYRATLLGALPETDGHGEALNKSKIQVLEALLRLRQAACHPGLIDRTKRNAPSAKLDMLLPSLEELSSEGHKTLVFSQFTSMLALLRKQLEDRGIAYEYLDGKTRDRQARVDHFQTDPDCRVFLISLKAGGTGLNLTAASYVFLLDPWWNPAVEAQAIDRAHRIGQQNRVFAYRYVARDTVEEKVMELQAQKRSLADAVIGEDNSLLRNLTRDELERLLS